MVSICPESACIARLEDGEADTIQYILITSPGQAQLADGLLGKNRKNIRVTLECPDMPLGRHAQPVTHADRAAARQPLPGCSKRKEPAKHPGILMGQWRKKVSLLFLHGEPGIVSLDHKTVTFICLRHKDLCARDLMDRVRIYKKPVDTRHAHIDSSAVRPK
ncbi:hypothetical protein SDC9_185185 [bioreactor metagenome]|uniref:Uncharacterized protein n=1 Tax=bioreactor metagenome TaxID=1076179 RepID=A0A645HF56_9ZZZZ